jgi:exonuclease SbcD
MSDSIHLLHFADVHLGVESYGAADPDTGLSARAGDFLARLDEVRAAATDSDADLVIFAGDAFKSRNPSPTYQRAFAGVIRDLAAICPVVLLLGSHDLPAGPGKAASIEIFHTLGVPNTLVAFEPGLHRVETKRGPVLVGAAPYPVRARLLPDRRARGATAAELDALLRDALAAELRELAAEAGDDPAPRVLAGHFSVAGALPGSEGAVMLSHDAPVPVEAVASDAWDYVALGYHHRQQAVPVPDGAPPVVYSGSLERFDFSEEGEPKGFVQVALPAQHGEGPARWEFIPVQARPFVTVRVDARDSRQPTEAVLDAVRKVDVTGAVVRVLARLGEANAHLLRDADVRRALLDAGADHVAVLQRDVEHALRARLGDSPERLPPAALLARYLEGKAVPPERIALLLEAARDILGEHAEA